MMEEKNASFAATFLEDADRTIERIKQEYTRQLDQAIELLFETWKAGRWVYIMGNGGSASSATHLAADLTKTITEKPGDRGIKAMALVDNIPQCSAFINDWGWDNIYVNQLATYYEPEGVGIALSVHGGSGTDLAGKWSQNVMKGLQYIKERGGKTIGFSGFDGGPMKDLVDVPIVVPADSTPLVEGFHVVLDHLVVFGLKERIHEYKKTSSIS
ncbi:MAG: SIS domain-containing protein [Candidatus Magasanikbacteria bacterium]|nr:SIS domain-containing protein [Candidatus Magasanikbacteria bacterium]